mgnify:CR=1 FL=1
MKLLPSVFALLATATLTHAGEKKIFNGTDLTGWEGNPKLWSVQDGAITGGSLTEKVPRNFFLATTRSYQNFDLTLRLKLTGVPDTGMINSGVQIRSLRVPGSSEMAGYQVDYGDGWYGKLYDESRRRKVLAAANQEILAKVLKLNDWNDYRIRCEGRHIELWINNVKTVDYTEPDEAIEQTGFIAVQIHGGGKAEVRYKDLVIEEF